MATYEESAYFLENPFGEISMETFTQDCDLNRENIRFGYASRTISGKKGCVAP